MLDFQIQQAPMRFGLAEGVDPHQVPFGTLTTAENACWDRSGSIQKRYGTTNLTTSIVGGGTISSGSRLFTRGKELGLITGSSLYSYTASGWKTAENLGKVCEVSATWTQLHDGYSGAMASDTAVLSDGTIVLAWVTGDPTVSGGTGSLYYQVFDPSKDALTTAPIRVGTASSTQVRIIANGTTWALVFNDSGSSRVRYCLPGNAVQTVSISTATTDAYFDACIIGTGWVLAYALNGGGIALCRYDLTSAPTLQASGTVTGETDSAFAISIDGVSGENIWIGYFVTGSSLRFRLATANASTLVQALAPTTIEAITAADKPTVGVMRLSSSSCSYAYSATTSVLSTGAYQDGAVRSHVVSSAGTATASRTTYNMRLLTRPFTVGGKVYAIVSSWFDVWPLEFLAIGTVPAGGDTYLIELPTTTSALTLPHRYVAHLDVLTAGTWHFAAHANVMALSSTEAACVVPYLSAPASSFVGWKQGLRLMRMTVGASLPADMWRPIQIGDEVTLTGGLYSSYDGRQAFDFGFAGPAFIDGNTVGSATGGSMKDGSYIYNVVPEYHSSVGMLHRGPTGPGITVVVPATTSVGSVALKVMPVSLSQKAPDLGAVSAPEALPVLLALHRSTVGQPIAQRLTIEPTYNVLLQDPTVGSPLPFTDTRNDSSIIPSATLPLSVRPPIYTAGGELDDFAPPSTLTQSFYQDRLWVVAGDKRNVWFSKDYSTNPGTAPGFHPTMILTFEYDVTALAPMDDKLIVFGSTGFMYVVGDGPAPNGQGGTYQAGLVQTDVGCTNPRSVASMPMGLLFQSTRGIYLLSRKLEVSWIGRPIKDELAAYPNITSAVVVAARNEVRWTANNAAGTASIVIVYNYVEDQWTTSRYTVGGVYGAPIADACLWNGVWTFVTTGGQVCTENSASFLDGGTAWVPLTLETSWNSATGPLAYQSVRKFALEGVSYSNHDLTVSVAFNNETAYVQTKTFAAGSPVTSIGPLESCEISIGTRRKCQAIRFKIQDATPTNPGTYPVGTGQGPSFDMLGIEVGLKRGFVPKSAAKTG